PSTSSARRGAPSSTTNPTDPGGERSSPKGAQRARRSGELGERDRRSSLRALMSDRTLFICKPDAVERGLVGEIVGRIKRKGLRIVAAALRTIDEATAGRHYAEHEGKPFYADLVA